MKPTKEKIFPLVMSALKEDVGAGDITSALLFEKDENVMANIIVSQACVLAGIDAAKWIFNALDEKITFRSLYNDGATLKKGKRVISLKGSIKNILSGERTALNFLGRLSGVATLTNRFVEKTKGTKAMIFDTRKTTPGLRELEKYAVTMGGGSNHRMGLWDGILIKDNHLGGLMLQALDSARAISEAVKKARQGGYRDVEIEVNSLEEFNAALEAGPEVILLDNMEIEDIRKAVRLRDKVGGVSPPLIEVSGGVDLEDVARIAKTGVDRISVGSLTHSAPSIDFSLEIYRS